MAASLMREQLVRQPALALIQRSAWRDWYGKSLDGLNRTFLGSTIRRKGRLPPCCAGLWVHESEPIRSFQTASPRSTLAICK